MARFLCALHAPDATPRAFALVEATNLGPDADPTREPRYVVRDLRALSGDDPTGDVLRATSSEPQYAGATVFVATGGQPAVDALHGRGPSAAAVTLTDNASATNDAHDVPLQVLVDTFERVFRAGDVEVPGALDAGSGAVDALYSAADLEAAAPGSDRDAAGDLDEGMTETLGDVATSGTGPSPSTVEQSGSAENVSTEAVEAPVTADEASAAFVDADRRVGRIAAATGADAPDLGDHADTAIALALAVWFGETTRDELPVTDVADEVLDARRDSAERRGGPMDAAGDDPSTRGV